MFPVASSPVLKLKFTLRVPAKELFSNIDENSPTRASKQLPSRPFSESDNVVAEFSALSNGLAFTGRFSDKYSGSTLLPLETRTYRNLAALIVGQLKNLAMDDTPRPLEAEIRNEIEKLRFNFEATLRFRRLDGEPSSRGQYRYDDAGLRSDEGNGTIRVKKTVDLFGEDFDYRNSFCGIFSNRSRMAGLVLRKQLGEQPVLLRLFDKITADPLFISGFLNLEVGEVPTAKLLQGARIPLDRSDAVSVLRNNFRLTSPLSIQYDSRRTLVRANFILPQDILTQTEIFLHWGRYPGLINPYPIWVDEEVLRRELVLCDDGSMFFEKEILPSEAGDYGVTMYVLPVGANDKIWANRNGGSDTQFSISLDQVISASLSHKKQVAPSSIWSSVFEQSVMDFELSVQNIYELSKKYPYCEIQRGLLELTAWDKGLQVLLSKYYARALRELATTTGLPKRKREVYLWILDNIGIGNIVLVTPEGPHAIAGGLAQMIVGLSESLARRKFGVTIITPLYEEAQGNKHPSADQILREGIILEGERSHLSYVGQIKVPIGPRLSLTNGHVSASPLNATVIVYSACANSLRVLFLRHHKLANRLYPTEWADQQLMKSIFLSRGALELIREPRYAITPSIIITNDWLAGLTQAFMQTDPRYANDEKLHQCATMHILHNCGRDYQGRIPLTQFGDDLWPLLGLSGEHRFGLADEQQPGFINVTRGAIFHTRGALVAVSKPYAEQLVKSASGEGLDTIFKDRLDRLVGISNGIDVESIRSIYCEIGEELAFEARGVHSKVLPSGTRFLQNVCSYKKATKNALQALYKLEKNHDAILISLVGRLAEQKGIKLLSHFAGQMSLLEEILLDYPHVQLIIAGPVSRGDPVGQELQMLLSDLEFKYPGRIRGLIDFIKHRDALSITLGSDLFMMPSRFEPGGITQLEALAAGTAVVAHAVGGLAATLRDYNEATKQGDSFLFLDYSSKALRNALDRALGVFRDDAQRLSVVRNAYASEHDWSYRLPKYLALFQHITGALSLGRHYRYLYDKLPVLDAIKVDVSRL